MEAAYMSDNKDCLFFNVVSFIVNKNKCDIINFDEDRAIIDIKGKTKMSELKCCYDLQKYFDRLIEEGF